MYDDKSASNRADPFRHARVVVPRRVRVQHPLGRCAGAGRRCHGDAVRVAFESWGTRFEGCRVIIRRYTGRQIHAAISQVEVHEVDHEALHRVRRITVTDPARSSQCGASPQSSRVQYAVARYVGTGAPQHARTPGASWPLSQACAWQDLLGTYEQCIRTWAQSLRNLRRRHAHADLKKSHASP